MSALHARLIADYCKRPELEAMLLDERLAYFAMHEAEKVLHGRHNGTDWLRNIYETSIHPCATSAERFDALGRVLNLWTE